MVNKFREYLIARDESPRAFARRSSLAINTVYKMFNGKKIRIDTAKWVQRVTKHKITLIDFGYD